MMDAMLGYILNKDIYLGSDIWKGKDVEPEMESYRHTNPALVGWGEATGMSPERTRYALEQYFTRGNIFTSLVGGAFRAMSKDVPERELDQATTAIISRTPGFRKFFKTTSPKANIRKMAEDLNRARNTSELKQNRVIDKLSSEFFQDDNESAREKFSEYIGTLPPKNRKRAVKRFKEYGMMDKIPQRGTLLSIKYQTRHPEDKAKILYYMTKNMNEEQRGQIIRNSNIIGLWSSSVGKEYGKLLNAGDKK